MAMGRALWISAATMASRVLGLARDQLFAALVGANAWSDAFVAAFRIPNLLRDLFAEGALSSAFVPTFAETHRNRGPEQAWQLANLVVGLVLTVVGTLTLLGVLFAPQVVAVVAPGFAPEQAAITVRLTRIMMPFLLLVSLAATAMGALNAQQRFTAPALAPALFNVGSIGVGLGLWFAGLGPEAAVTGWSVGTLFGGLLQLFAQAPALHRLGYRFRPRLGGALGEPGVRRIARLMGAAVIGLSATQVNIVVNTIFASHEDRAVTWLNFAFRLMQFPLGVFGVAIATVAGAGVARKAAERLALLASPIISLIYEHGRFRASDTAGTAQALLFYALGLYAYSAVKVLAPAFYAFDLARVPLIGSVMGMVANVGLNLALYPVLGYRGVALGTSLAATMNFAVLAIAWRLRFGDGGSGLGPGIWRQLAKVVVASAVLGVVAWGTHHLVAARVTGHGLGRQAVRALVPVAAGGLAYLAAAAALGVAELQELWGALRRRAGRRAGA